MEYEVELNRSIKEIVEDEVSQAHLMLLADILGNFACPVHGGTPANLGFESGTDGKTIVRVTACCQEMEALLIERLQQAR